MKTVKCMAGIIIFACLMSGCKALGQKTEAFAPIQSSGFESDSYIARKIKQKLPNGPRPPVTIAIIEKIADTPSRQLFAETALHYYLDYCSFPVKNGENALLRAYAGFYFTDKPRNFPLTLTSKYYIIGFASAEPGTNQSDLIGATSELEIRVLDREGKMFYGKKVKMEALALSLEAAEAKALKAAASEVAIQVLPLLR